MAIGDDFSIAENGDIRYTGTTTNYTVIDFHRWLGDLMDDASATGNDLLDITDATASDRATDNLITLNAPYNIDDTAAEHLYDGSIVQDDGDTIYDGIVVIAAAGMPLDIIQNGSIIANDFWGSGLNADAANGLSHRFMVKVRTGGADIDGRRLVGQTREFGKTYSEFRINGTSRGNNVLALTYTDDLNNATANATVAGWTTIKNNTEGFANLDIGLGDGINENYYSQWIRAGYTINQFYERMKWISQSHNGGSNTDVIYGLAGNVFRGVTHQIPIDNGIGTWGTPPNQDEQVSWSGGTGRLLAVNNTASASATKMWIQLLTGIPPINNEVITGGTSSANAQCNGSPTERTISTPFCGQSTGSAIIGAYGFGMYPGDLTNLDTFFDLDNNAAQNPPNNVQFQVGGLSTDDGGDRILVAPLGYYFPYQGELSGPFQVDETLTFTPSGATAYLSELNDLGTTGYMKVRMLTGSVPPAGEIFDGGTSSAHANVAATPVVSEDPRQLITTIALTGAAETQAVMTTAIPSDSPTAGSVRIKMDSGIYKRCAYSSFSGNTFTFSTTIDFSGANVTAVDSSAFISYIDKNAVSETESFTVVYSSNRGVFIRVRYGSNTSDAFTPIKTFETSGTISSSGGTATAIRTADA